MADYDFPRSTSQRRTFRECGWKYPLKYGGDHWTPKLEKGAFPFGHAMEHVAHGVVPRILDTPEEAQACFEAQWLPLKNAPGYVWGERASWATFYERGKVLARMAVKELRARMQPLPYLASERITYRIGEARELAILDALAMMQEQVVTYDGTERKATWSDRFLWTVVDYKTSQYEYAPLQVENDEQLTNYQLGATTRGHAVAQVAFVVFCWGYAQPRIQFLVAPARDAAELERFTHGAIEIDRQIRAGMFVRNDRACHAFGGCEYRPICFPSQNYRIGEELKIDTRRDPEALALDDGGE